MIPAYTDIQRVDRDVVRGIVEFDNREDLKRAIKDLDGAPWPLKGLIRGYSNVADPSICQKILVLDWSADACGAV